MSAPELELYLPPRAWGLPSPSPFCVKLETWVRMAELPYVARAGNPVQAPRGKVPYARWRGEWLADSQVVLDRLRSVRDLDDHLSAADRARAHLIRRTVEEATYFLTLHQRWCQPENFAVVRPALFGALGPAAPLVAWVVQRRVRAATWAQGAGRYAPEERDRMGEADVDAIVAWLGPGPYLAGDRPCTADAALYGFVCQWLWAPFDGAIQRRARGALALVAYGERIRDRWWAEIPPLA